LGRVRAGEDQVVRRSPQRGGRNLAAVPDDPEAPERVDLGSPADRAGDAEDEVVPRLVSEQERLGLLEEGRCMGEPHSLHASSPPDPGTATAASTSGAACTGGEGRFSRHGSLQTAAGAAAGGSDRGGFSVRNAVVTRPARTSGCATSQRRKGRLVVTPPISV